MHMVAGGGIEVEWWGIHQGVVLEPIRLWDLGGGIYSVGGSPEHAG